MKKDTKTSKSRGKKKLFCRSLFVLLFIVLSVFLLFTDSDYPFVIFKLFLLGF